MNKESTDGFTIKELIIEIRHEMCELRNDVKAFQESQRKEVSVFQESQRKFEIDFAFLKGKLAVYVALGSLLAGLIATLIGTLVNNALKKP